MIFLRRVAVIAVIAGLTGCHNSAWRHYAGPPENSSQVDVENHTNLMLWPNTWVDGDACEHVGFGDLDGKSGKLATIVEPGRMARFNVEKNKLLTIRLLFTGARSLGYGSYSTCEIIYSFVPKSDRYELNGRLSPDGAGCYTRLTSTDGSNTVAVKRTLVPGQLFQSPYCPLMSAEDRQKLGLPFP